MINQPLVSIIIPTYNRADLLPETLDSIIAQTYTNWECIVVDDGSTDNTAEVLKKYIEQDPRFYFYNRPNNLPKSGNSCRNYGFGQSKGDLIVFFDSDDVMLDDFLSSRVHLFDDQTQVVFATYTTVNENLKFLKQNKFTVSDVLVKEYMFWNFPILTHSALIRKSFLLNKTLFDPKIKRGQETDFYLNILPNINKDQFLYVKKPTFLYRLHDNSITGGTKQYNPEYMESLISIRAKALNVGKEIRHKELEKNSYLHLIVLLFQIIKNKDFKNLRNFNHICKNINQISKIEKIEVMIVSNLLCIIGLTPKILEKRWISFFS